MSRGEPRTLVDAGVDTSDPRIQELILALERLAAGQLDERATISSRHDSIDAVAHGVNVLAGELQYASRNQRRAMHAAEAASRAKTAFLRNVSDEIRVSLQGILEQVQLLAGPGVEDSRREEVRSNLLTRGRALLALAEELLDVSKVEAGAFEFEMRSVALRETVTDIVRSMEPEAHRKTLDLLLEIVPPLPSAIVTDPRRLHQILTHIVGNAIKFTTRGRVVVRLQAAGAAAIAVDVIDTGIGISASHAETIFTPFHPAEPSTGRGLGSAGLGLALSRRLAVGMGGDVRLVESRPGGGTTFCVLLPVGAA
jgi:signal transduction histidine kinase